MCLLGCTDGGEKEEQVPPSYRGGGVRKHALELSSATWDREQPAQLRSREPARAKGEGDCKPEASLSPTWAPEEDLSVHAGRQGLSKAELPLQ